MQEHRRQQAVVLATYCDACIVLLANDKNEVVNWNAADAHADKLKQGRDHIDRDVERQQHPDRARPAQRQPQAVGLLGDRPRLAVDWLRFALLPWPELLVEAP